ncbi:MAG: hypothetical protein E7569_00505 [Ruminococcaceae bacterium]|nr:hypothetical protein [Oscillospiraceae bacterium]
MKGMLHRGKLLKRIFAVPEKFFIPIKQKLSCCFLELILLWLQLPLEARMPGGRRNGVPTLSFCLDRIKARQRYAAGLRLLRKLHNREIRKQFCFLRCCVPAGQRNPQSAVAYNKRETALCGVCHLSCANFGGLHVF